MGLCSFFLISSFFFRFKTRFASFIALFWNLSGDLFLLIYFLFYLIFYLSFNFVYFYFYFFFYMFLIFPIFCKSAVFPFHAWLFYAMEGPTPVSAFLHAASMITAGIFFFFIFPFYFNPFFFFLFSFFTTVYFAFCAILYFDIKRMIASSTGSQIGYIFFFLSILFITNAFYLLFIHAIFKFFLFFIAGYFVSVFLNFQDFRMFSVNFTYFFLVSFPLLALGGLFFF